MKKLIGLFVIAAVCGCQPATVSDPQLGTTPPVVDEGTAGETVVDAQSAGLDVDALPPSDAPVVESFADAVEQLQQLRDTVSAGFAAKDVESIHDKLHDVGDLLEATLEVLQASDLADEQKKEASAAVESLFDDFGAVDAKLHDQPGKDYAEVSDSIDVAIQKLSDLVKK